MTNTIHIVTGAAGFIGSHLVDKLLNNGHIVIGIDNFSLGKKGNIEQALQNSNFHLIECNLNDTDMVIKSIESLKLSTIDTIWHLAANSDISGGVQNSNIDFQNTFLTTYTTLQVAKHFNIKKFAFASSSAIYGVHSEPLHENMGPLFPISNYGAMKLASEAIISASTETYINNVWLFRFPNVIGPRATHGVIHDFLHKLKKDPSNLPVLGNGTQEKPYIYVHELIDALLYIYTNSTEKINYFNIGSKESSATTVKDIAEKVVTIAFPNATISYTDDKKGWIGDIPKFAYNTSKLKQLGWEPKKSSNEAVEATIHDLIKEIL